MQTQLAAYANRTGLQLGTVYFECTGSLPLFEHADQAPAYMSLLAGLRGSQAVGVVVPSLDAFRDEQDKCVSELEGDLGVVVHAVDAEDVNDPRD
ncbi:hypothetical protein PWY87_34480 [Kribbella solani]|uniref:hypothetical protein n=1 Tax=Kribbella solani TaxID=236067 RepID=UPI0029A9D31A|nr:hypothetical protein [Kribbella solani]MDX3006825.1 hypothetical protein [Kribbella solani]